MKTYCSILFALLVIAIADNNNDNNDCSDDDLNTIDRISRHVVGAMNLGDPVLVPKIVNRLFASDGAFVGTSTTNVTFVFNGSTAIGQVFTFVGFQYDYLSNGPVITGIDCQGNRATVILKTRAIVQSATVTDGNGVVLVSDGTVRLRRRDDSWKVKEFVLVDHKFWALLNTTSFHQPV